jgi:hypothetical protein
MVTSRFSGGKIALLAREFSRLLVQSLGKETVKKINRLNKAEEDPNVCHSHDFCDANMVMHEAQENLKLNLDLENQRDVNLWGDAWNFAVKNGFFLK